MKTRICIKRAREREKKFLNRKQNPKQKQREEETKQKKF